MKKILIFLFSLSIVACSNSNNDDLQEVKPDQGVNLIQNLSKSESAETIAKLEEKVASTLDPNISFDSSELKKINDRYYLVSKHGEFTTTSLLKIKSNKASNEVLEFDGISCTSKTCATSNGCIPHESGTKCTPCNFGTGDCTKTVSK
tara:strand:+ start:528 stop:971 length:444 start_codon:yes stop_codon:yes gene_type:complete